MKRLFFLMGLVAGISGLLSCSGPKSKKEFKTATEFAKHFCAKDKDALLGMLTEQSRANVNMEFLDSCLLQIEQNGLTPDNLEAASYSSGKVSDGKVRYDIYTFCPKGEPHKGAVHRLSVYMISSELGKVQACYFSLLRSILFVFPRNGLSGITEPDKMHYF
jgi:hypothetical protein